MAGRVIVRKGKKLLARKAPSNGMTDKKRAIFLAALAETGNIRHAAATAGVSPQTAYTLKAKDIGFRVAWGDALCEGYATLEAWMLERAIRAMTPDEVPAPGEVTAPAAPPPLSERAILTLLAQHRQTVRELREERARRAAMEAGEALPSDEEARAAMHETLKQMRERIAAAEGDAAAWDGAGDEAGNEAPAEAEAGDGGA